MTPVFFYGLFMDAAALEAMGWHPEVVGVAELRDFELRIGKRATLRPREGARCYGVVLTLPGDELTRLYAQESVADYRAQSLGVTLTGTGSHEDVLCYLLPENEAPSPTNTAYAEELLRLAHRLGLPECYIAEIAALAASG